MPRLPLESTQIREGALRRDAVFRRSLIAADAFAASGALLLMATGDSAMSLRWTSVAVLPLVVLISKLLGLYDRDDLVFHKSTLDEAPSLFHVASLFAILLWFLQGVLITGPLDRPGMVELWIGFFLLAVGGRTLARHLARAVSPVERCLVIGPSDARMRFATKLMRAHRGTEIVGHLPLEDERRRTAVPVQADQRNRDLTLADLDEMVGELDAHRVIIIPGEASNDKMLEAVSRAKAVGVKVSILPRMFEVVGSSIEFDDVEGMTVLGVRRLGLSRSSRFIKRATDAALSGLALIVLAPLIGLLAVSIRLSSPGRVLFRQRRVGRDGRTFEMLKFRSMVDGAHEQRTRLEPLNESVGLFKIADDPRTTRLGRMMRRASLDELPQLINVMRGEMSLVGPRPLVIDEDRRVEGRHRGRLKLTPGITGPWQLLGPTRVPLEDMVTMDYLYGANWSLWTDVKILLRTVAHVLSRRGV